MRGGLVGLMVSLLLTTTAGAFTDATLIEDCAGTADPLAGSWGGKVLSGHTNQLKSTGGTCTRSSAGGAGTGSSYWNGATYQDVAVSLTVTDATSTGDNDVSIFVRVANPGVSSQVNGYICAFRPNGTNVVELFRIDSSTISAALATTTNAAFDVNDGHKIGCEMIGSTLKAYVNVGAGWVEALSTTDSTYTAAGNIAVRMATSNHVIDTIGAQAVVASGGPRRPLFSP